MNPLNQQDDNGHPKLTASLLHNLKYPAEIKTAPRCELEKQGTLHPYDGNSIIIPESMVKGKGAPDRDPYWFGVL